MVARRMRGAGGSQSLGWPCAKRPPCSPSCPTLPAHPPPPLPQWWRVIIVNVARQVGARPASCEQMHAQLIQATGSTFCCCSALLPVAKAVAHSQATPIAPSSCTPCAPQPSPPTCPPSPGLQGLRRPHLLLPPHLHVPLRLDLRRHGCAAAALVSCCRACFAVVCSGRLLSLSACRAVAWLPGCLRPGERCLGCMAFAFGLAAAGLPARVWLAPLHLLKLQSHAPLSVPPPPSFPPTAVAGRYLLLKIFWFAYVIATALCIIASRKQ